MKGKDCVTVVSQSEYSNDLKSICCSVNSTFNMQKLDVRYLLYTKVLNQQIGILCATWTFSRCTTEIHFYAVKPRQFSLKMSIKAWSLGLYFM